MSYVQFIKAIVKNDGDLDAVIDEIDAIMSCITYHKFMYKFYTFVEDRCWPADYDYEDEKDFVPDFVSDMFEDDPSVARNLFFHLETHMLTQKFLTRRWQIAKFGRVILKFFRTYCRYNRRKWLNAIFKHSPCFSGLQLTGVKLHIAGFLGC